MKCFRKREGKSFGAGQRARGVGAGGEETWLRTALCLLLALWSLAEVMHSTKGESLEPLGGSRYSA